MNYYNQVSSQSGVFPSNDSRLSPRPPHMNMYMPAPIPGPHSLSAPPLSAAAAAMMLAKRVVGSMPVSSSSSTLSDAMQPGSSWNKPQVTQNMQVPVSGQAADSSGESFAGTQQSPQLLMHNQQQQQQQMQDQQQSQFPAVFVLKRDASSKEQSIGQYIVKSPPGGDNQYPLKLLAGNPYIVKPPSENANQYIVKPQGGTFGDYVVKPPSRSTGVEIVSKVKASGSGAETQPKRGASLPASVQVLTQDMQETFHSYKELSDCHMRMGFTSQCQICDKNFGHWRGLQRHLKRHANFRPYVCKVCDMTFHCQDKMRRHEDTHIGLKPHKCPICDIGLSRREHLKRHLLIHSETKPFACSICGYSGKRVDNVRKHIKTKHEDGTARVVVAACAMPLPTSPATTSSMANSDNIQQALNVSFGPLAGVPSSTAGSLEQPAGQSFHTGLPVFPGFIQTGASDDGSSDPDVSNAEDSESNSPPENDIEVYTDQTQASKGKHKRKPSHPTKSHLGMILSETHPLQ